MAGILNIRFFGSLGSTFYCDIEGLPNPLTLSIPIGITNTTDVALYVQANLVAPPVGYAAYTDQFGVIAANSSDIFIWTIDRTTPALVGGELSENITARIEFYTDAGYLALYNQQTLNITIEWFDKGDVNWTQVDVDTFDGGTREGWVASTGIIDVSFGGGNAGGTLLNSTHFLSTPYSLAKFVGGSITGYIFRKLFDASGLGYTKARVIIHYRLPAGTSKAAIKVGDDLILTGAVSNAMPREEWIRMAYSFPVNVATYVRVQTNDGTEMFGIDEIYIIGK